MADKQNWLERVRAGEGFENPDWDFLKAIFAGKARATAFNAMRIGDLEQMQELTRTLDGIHVHDSYIGHSGTIAALHAVFCFERIVSVPDKEAARTLAFMKEVVLVQLDKPP